MRTLSLALLAGLAAFATAAPRPDDKPEAPLNTPPRGFTALFNGKDFENWQICIPIVQRNKLKAMGGDAYEKAVKAANDKNLKHWTIDKGVLHYDGKGFSLQT